LNACYKAAEKENRQPRGTLRDVTITNGTYNEAGGAYMFYGVASSNIEFPNKGGLDTRFSITLMCWVQPGSQDGPLFSYGVPYPYVSIEIEHGKLFNRILLISEDENFLMSLQASTSEVLPAGKWAHVAASYDYSSGNNSLYINGHLRASQKVDPGFTCRIANASQRVRMGARNQSNGYFKGKIAEMKVYDVALNGAQIQTSIRQGSCTFFSKSFSHYPLQCFL